MLYIKHYNYFCCLPVDGALPPLSRDGCSFKVAFLSLTDDCAVRCFGILSFTLASTFNCVEIPAYKSPNWFLRYRWDLEMTQRPRLLMLTN